MFALNVWQTSVLNNKEKDKRSDLKPEKEETKTDWIESTDILTIQICSLGNPGCTIDIPGYQTITIGNGKTKEIKFTTDTDSNNKPLLDAFMNRTGPITVNGTT